MEGFAAGDLRAPAPRQSCFSQATSWFVRLAAFACLALLASLSTATYAQAPTLLDEVVVTGQRPGPALWRATREGHVLWILGTLQPLPRKMVWNSKEVEKVLAVSQEVIVPSVGDIGVDADLFQVIDLMQARKLADGRRLKDVLPPELYGRWETLKASYLGNRSSVDRKRPRFAAKDLFKAAVDKLGLTMHDTVTKSVIKLAKKKRIPVAGGKFTLRVNNDVDEWAREVKALPVQYDLPCFEATILRLEKDTAGMVARANAWAVGDMDTIERSTFVDQTPICDTVLSNLDSFREAQEEKADQLSDRWFTETEQAIKANQSTLVLMPIHALPGPDGLLANLRERGFAVDQPDS